MKCYKPIEINSVRFDVTKIVDVKSREGLDRIARTLEKPVLEIKEGRLEYMGVKILSDDNYRALMVIDGGIVYMFREKVKNEGKKRA